MRRRVRRILGWIHGGILLSVQAPILYGLFTRGEEMYAYDMERVWLLNLLILAVIVGTDLLVERCRRMSVYLLCSALCVTVIDLAAWQMHGFVNTGDIMDTGVGAAVILLLESLVVFVERLQIRLHDKKSVDRREKNPDWQPRHSMLTRPQVIYIAVLVFAYGVGKYCNNPPLCNIAVGLLPVYLCAALFYRYLDRTQEYAFLNKRVCNLPKRKLYGINGSICLVFLSGIICMGILSGLTAGYRSYQDVRELFRGQMDIFEAPPAQLLGEMLVGADEMSYLTNMEVREHPAWMKIVENGLAAAVVIMLILLSIYGLRRVGSLFRETFDENGDVVEELEEEKDVAERIKSVRVVREKLTEEERIRRQYRRTIRRHRKDCPGRHEAPYEIETRAGIADTEDGKRLHEAYEKARYHGNLS